MLYTHTRIVKVTSKKSLVLLFTYRLTMFSSGIRNLIQLLSILLLINVIFAIYEVPNIRRYPPILNTQRSADSGYRYAWFTRDIHDDGMSNEENNYQDEPIPPQRILSRMKLLKNIYNRHFMNSDANLLDSNEKISK